jgi:Tol biopolymer transport system component
MKHQVAFARHGRPLAEGQVSQLTVIDIETGSQTVVFETDANIEAPNWTPDGAALIFNAGGEIWRIDHQGQGAPQKIVISDDLRFNNDHVLSPDGRLLYLSANDGHLYVSTVEGGAPKRVSNTHDTFFRYYLHGISPDGATLSYVAIEGEEPRRINVFTIPSAGGPDRRLTDLAKPHDGPEYSPDGAWIYFNSERAAERPGHAQIFRMKPDGSDVEQLTFDERVNWFPHLSPDGRHMVYISYPEGTLGHPPDHDVILRLIHPDGGKFRDLAAFNGGQGTINVNSWAPDSRRFAFVAYPFKN